MVLLKDAQVGNPRGCLRNAANRSKILVGPLAGDFVANYPLDVPGFENDPLWFKAPLIGAPRLMQGESKAGPGDEIFERVVIDDRGREVVATLEKRMGGLDLPLIKIDGERYKPTPTIPGPEFAAGLAPMLLALTAGVPGAIMGIAAVLINLPVLRSGRPVWQRMGILVGVLVLAVLGTAVIRGIVESAG